MSRLIIISNRLPFAIECSDEKLVVRQSSGGLVSAIKSYFEKQEAASGAYSDRIWIGSMEASEEDWNKAKESMPAARSGAARGFRGAGARRLSSAAAAG